MDKTVLVALDVGLGTRLIDVLDRAGLKVNVALWALLSDYGDLRLILASKHFDPASELESYRVVSDVLQAANISAHQSLMIMIMLMKDPFIRDLRRIYGKNPNIEGMRLGGQTFGERHVEDGYVYRII